MSTRWLIDFFHLIRLREFFGTPLCIMLSGKEMNLRKLFSLFWLFHVLTNCTKVGDNDCPRLTLARGDSKT